MLAIFKSWLTPERLKVYPRAFLVSLLLAFVAMVATTKDLITAQGVPLGGDFKVFYAVGSLVSSGEADALFDLAAISDAQQQAIGHDSLEVFHPWPYPPYVAVLLAPLALLPYLPAYLVFTGLMGTALWFAVTFLGQIRPWIAEHRGSVFCIAISSYPLLKSVPGGQNTSLTLMLICGALAMTVGRREIGAGLLIGLLLFKPHFAAPLMAMLAISRRWTALATSAAVGIVYGLLAVLVFGWDWPGRWLESLAAYRAVEAGANGPTLVSFLGVCEYWLGAAQPAAFWLAVFPSLAVIGLVCALFWRARGDQEKTIAAWGVGAAALILVSPHTQFYDVGLLCLPLALLADRDRLATEPLLLLLWGGGWSSALFDEPIIQPMFLVAVAGFVYSLRLWRVPIGAQSAQH